MQGKVVVVTGATSGIGEVAAQRLSAMGARIVFIARDRARGEATISRLPKFGAGAAHTVYYGDLSRISEMKRIAAQITAAEPCIDVLINNAGGLFGSRQMTEDNLERTFATNHMSYFVLTHGLRNSLFASPAARIVNTASAAHQGNVLDFDDLQSAKAFSAPKVYGRSKLCNILFTRELALRWSGKPVTANSLHPGFVATRFGDASGGFLARAVKVAKLFAISPEKGAQTIIYLAASPELAGVSGQYFYQCKSAKPSAAALDNDAAARLWSASAVIAGIPA